jgi:hypothetical protein
MNSLQRPLAGCAIGLSISESDDSTNRGFPAWQVNRVTLQVVEALFSQGAGVIFGHDWRDDGVMEAVHSFARQMQSPVPLPLAEAEATGQPLLRNLLPWPDKPHLSEGDIARLTSTLRVETAGLPAELAAQQTGALSAGAGSAPYRYVRARGLTHLRHQLDSLSDARLCLGGRRGGSAGRYPGVIEEALLAVQSGTPLFLAGLLGGATKQVIDAIERKEMPDKFCQRTQVNDLYKSPPFVETDPATKPDRVVDRTAIWAAFMQTGVSKLAAVNRLTEDENQDLFHTPVLDRVIQLVLMALSRLRTD